MQKKAESSLPEVLRRIVTEIEKAQKDSVEKHMFVSF